MKSYLKKFQNFSDPQPVKPVEPGFTGFTGRGTEKISKIEPLFIEESNPPLIQDNCPVGETPESICPKCGDYPLLQDRKFDAWFCSGCRHWSDGKGRPYSLCQS